MRLAFAGKSVGFGATGAAGIQQPRQSQHSEAVCQRWVPADVHGDDTAIASDSIDIGELIRAQQDFHILLPNTGILAVHKRSAQAPFVFGRRSLP